MFSRFAECIVKRKTDPSRAPVKSRADEFSRRVIFALTLVALGMLVGYFFADQWPNSIAPKLSGAKGSVSGILYSPWITAEGRTIVNGLAEFSNRRPDPEPASERFSALAAALLLYVVAPILFFGGWRKWIAEHAEAKVRRMIRSSTLTMLAGGAIVLATSVHAVSYLPLQWKNISDWDAGRNVQNNKIAMVYIIKDIAWQAHQYRVLPAGLGGGNGTYAGFPLPKEYAKAGMISVSLHPANDVIDIETRSGVWPNAYVNATINEEGRVVAWRYAEVFE